MLLLNQLTCLFRGHALGDIEPDVFWYSATCQCCGKTMTADTALELLMRRDVRYVETVLSPATDQKVHEIAPAI